MFHLKKTPSLVLAALVAVAIPIVPTLEAEAQSFPAQPNSLTLPDSVATGTRVWIDGDPSLKPATESLSSSFEEQFPGAQINYESQGSDPAVTGVISGRLDVAAIGRGLTRLEERAGVETLSLAREKIAIFVSVENAFRGEVSDQQFAQIFRGEITNWSELGGEDLPIRFIDLAATSDTRRALSSYDLFEDAPFESGDTAVIQPNNISSVIETLGNDGIAYALYAQVKDRSDIRILPMHGVMPTDVRYPFSQPRNFAYLGANPTPEAIAFLGYVNDTAPTATQSQNAGPQDWTLGRNAKAQHLAFQSPLAAGKGTVADSTLVLGSHNSAAGSAAGDGTKISYRPGIMDTIHAPWWWLVPLAPLGVIGFAAMRRKRLDEAKAAEMGTAAASAGLNGASLASLGAAGAGLTGVGLAARGLRGMNGAQWGSNSLATGTVANDDAASFALGMPQNQTPHHQTVNELDLEQQAPQGADRDMVEHQRPSLQPHQPLEQPIHNKFNGPTVALTPGSNDSTPPPADTPNLTFPKPNQSPESLPGLGVGAGAGLAAAGLTAASMAAADKTAADRTAADRTAASNTNAAATEPLELAGPEPLVANTPEEPGLPGEIGDGEASFQKNRPDPKQQPAAHESNVRHLSERRRRELVDQSIDKALERPNGGKKAMPPQDQPLQDLELQYGNPKPEQSRSETAATGESVDQRSFENPAAPRNQNKLSANDSTALGNALKRAGLGAAGMAGAAGIANHQAGNGKANHPPEPAVAGTSIPTPTGPSSRLDIPMAGHGNSDNEQTWITLTSLNSHQGEVNWHVSEEHRLQAKQQGGQRMMIRIHDAAPNSQPESWLPSSYTYECRNSDRKQVDLPVADRDYIAEIGFLTAEEDWIHVARSVHSHSPTAEYDGCRIVIMPCDPHRQMRNGPTRNPKPQAYVYWDIAPEFKRRLRKQGGQMLALRIFDADHINLDQQPPHHTDEYMLDENARDKVVTVPTAEHDYVAEIGYLTMDGDFLSLGRSVYAHIPVTVA